jgi:hypothetical protein
MIRFELYTGIKKFLLMTLNALLRFGIVTSLLVVLVLPLAAWKKAESANLTNAKSSLVSLVDATEKPSTDIPADLPPAVLAATYSGKSGCAATEHNFEIVVDVLDAGTNLYRVRNLLDEGEIVKARWREGKLQLGSSQKMGSYQISGYVEYLESPARIETHVKYQDGLGFCEDVSVFVKR